MSLYQALHRFGHVYWKDFSPQFRLLEEVELNEEEEEFSRVIIPAPAHSYQYEIGLKKTWLNDRLQTNCSYYDIEKTKIAALIRAQSSTGYECDIAGSLNSNWHLVASISKLNAKVIDSDDEDFIGLKPRMTPEHTASLWLNKDIRFSEHWQSRWGVGLKHVDQRFINIDNEVELDQYQLVDLSLSLNYNDKLNLTFFVRNLFDQEYTEGVFNALPYWTNPGSERTIESRLSYQF